MKELPNITLPSIKLPGVLKSKRFWIIISAMIVDMFLFFYPDLNIDRNYAVEVVTAGGLFLSGLYGVEDLMVAFRSGAHKDKYL